MNNIIIITWKSWSGKTTLSNYLEENCGYSIPYNYTTRSPRVYDEKDYSEYCFISPSYFEWLWEQDRLLNRTEFNWNQYGIGIETLNLEKLVFVVDSDWREKLLQIFPTAQTVWVETSDFERRKRLYARGLSWLDLEARLDWLSEQMNPSSTCIIVDGTTPVKEIVYSLIEDNKWTE
mgnify:CR=1 FL=1